MTLKINTGIDEKKGKEIVKGLSTLLADSLASSLSENAKRHLRAAQIVRYPEQTVHRDSLRAELLLRGFATPEPLLDLEARAGGAGFAHGILLGAACFLRACPSLRPKDLPLLEGEPGFPVYGDPSHIAEEWESPFCVMVPSGAIGVYGDIYRPTPAFNSLEHFLEIEALAPFSDSLHVVRVDALCGGLLAGLVDVLPHTPATGEYSSGWAGHDAWVKELRVALPGEEIWSSYYGTFLMTENTDLVVDVISLLLEQGFSLGYKGPCGKPTPGEAEVLSFVDAYPELGYRSSMRVTVWGKPGAYIITRREEKAY